MLLLGCFAIGIFPAYFIHRLMKALLNFIFNVGITMNTDTSHADNIIRFPKGLIGLSEQTQLQLFHEAANDEPTVHWLQSVSDSGFSMSVISPSTLGMEYEIEFSNDDLESLQLDNPADALVLLVV